METSESEPDAVKRHIKNLNIAKMARNEYDLQVLCARDSDYVAKAYALAQTQNGDLCIVQELLTGGNLS